MIPSPHPIGGYQRGAPTPRTAGHDWRRKEEERREEGEGMEEGR